MSIKQTMLPVFIAFVLIVSALAGTPVLAESWTWYVDDSGGVDFTTISEAVAAADADDTIIVKDGTYIENVLVDKSIVIQSENGAASTVVTAALSGTPVFDIDADSVEIDGFTVQGPTDEHVAGIELIDVYDCTVHNNDCSLCYNGIHLGGTATGNTVTDNYCHDNTRRGISVRDSASGNFISENIVQNNVDAGFCIKDNPASNVVWLNDVIGNGVELLTDNTYHSADQLTYTYNGNSYTGYLGNYYYDYAGSDADGDGIGDTPYSFDTYSDDYPLMETYENYTVEDEPSGNSASLVATTNIVIGIVGIDLDRESINYGNIVPGEDSNVETIGINNTGTLDVNVTLEVQGTDATSQSFYEQSLYIEGDLYNISDIIGSIPVEDSININTQLHVPSSWAEPGVQEAQFIFWAEAAQ